jgi:hypothetical protein
MTTGARFISRACEFLALPAVHTGWDEEFDTRESDTFAPSERAASESQGQGVALLGARRTQQQDIAGQSRDECFTPLPEHEFDQRANR